MSKEKNVLVAGANGTTGRIIIDLLKKSDKYQPIAMVRKQEQKEHFEKENVTAVLADLEEDLSNAFKNVDKVIFAAGSGGKMLKELIRKEQKNSPTLRRMQRLRNLLCLALWA